MSSGIGGDGKGDRGVGQMLSWCESQQIDPDRCGHQRRPSRLKGVSGYMVGLDQVTIILITRQRHGYLRSPVTRCTDTVSVCQDYM